jgi:hypothetical protein
MSQENHTPNRHVVRVVCVMAAAVMCALLVGGQLLIAANYNSQAYARLAAEARQRATTAQASASATGHAPQLSTIAPQAAVAKKPT